MAQSASSEGRTGWSAKGTLLFSSFPYALALGAASPILPKMSDELAHNAMEAYLVKMVAGIVGASIVLSGPIAGALADKIARRPLFAGACVLFALAGAAPLGLNNLFLILLMRFLMGAGAVTAFIVGTAFVGDVFDEPVIRSRWMGYIMAAAMAYALVTGIISGVLGDFGWRWAFLVYLAGLPVAALGWHGIPRGRAVAASATKADPALEAVSRQPFRIGLIFLAFFCGVMIYVPSIYIPFQLHTIGLSNPSSIAFALMLSVIPSMTVASLFGQARRFASSRSLFCFSFAIAGAGVAIIALAPAPPMALVGLFILGIGMGWISPNLIAATLESVDEAHRGRMLGIVRAAESLAPVLGVTALEPLAGPLGVKEILLLTTALAALLAIGTAAGGGMKKRPIATQPAINTGV